MPDPFNGNAPKENAPAAKSPKGDKRRQQIMIAGTVAMVLLGYLTYRKIKSGSTASTVSPAASAVPALPIDTGTDVPSGTAAPQTTIPYAAPTDTTGGGSIPITSGTPTVGAPSETVPPVSTTPTTPAPATPTPVQAQAVTPAKPAPVVAPHPTAPPAVATPVASTVHPSTVSGTV